MKILFLDHPQHTAGTWTLFEGLIRILGADAIVVFPYKAIYVGQDMDVNHYPWYRDVYKDIADGKPLPAGIPPLAPGFQEAAAAARPAKSMITASRPRTSRNFRKAARERFVVASLVRGWKFTLS